MRIFKYFWIPLILYFVAVHPAILYYNNHPPYFLEQKSPVAALIYVGIAVIGWVVILTYGLVKIRENTFGIRDGIRRLSETGKLVDAKIVGITNRKPVVKEFETKEIVVSFDNFSGTPINYTLILTDTKPHLNRYELGKTMRLRVDPDLKYLPYVIPDDAAAKLNAQNVTLLYGLWALTCLGVTGYFIYAYTTENQGYGWRFLTWGHPLIMSLLVLAGLGLIYVLIRKFILSNLSGIKNRKAMKLLFYGRHATATVTEISQTGTYINDQPQVKFEMTFVDEKGTTHGVSLKKIIPFIHLQTVHQPNRAILYLPDSPTTIAFESDILA